MLAELPLRFVQDDGTIIDETVNVDFTDVDVDVLSRAVTECAPDDTLGMTAILVHSRLSDPDLASPAMLKAMFEEAISGS